MAIARFTLTDDHPATFEVHWSWWGKERYLFEGVLLRSVWDLTSFTGMRTFQVNGHEVRISWSAKEAFVTNVYVDGKLRVENLFPQLTLKREPFSWKRWFRNVATSLVIGVVATIAYKYWRG